MSLSFFGSCYEAKKEYDKALSAREYIPNLAEEITAVFPNREKISIQTEIEDITLPVEILSPLGIITTELITNAMKYGFSDLDKGLLYLRLSRRNKEVVYEIRNNGTELPDDFSIEESQGFGLRLVNMLIQQLNGSITAENDKETRFIMTFPLLTQNG